MKRCLPLLAILFSAACGKVSVAPGALGGSGAMGQVRANSAAVEALPETRARVIQLCGHLQTADSNMRNVYLGRTFNFTTSRTNCSGRSLGASDSAAVLALQSDKPVLNSGGVNTPVETHMEGRMAHLCKAISTGLTSPLYTGSLALYYSIVPCPNNSRVTCVTIETGVRIQGGNYVIEQVDEYAVESHSSAGGLIGQVRSQRRSTKGSCSVIGEAEVTVVDLLSVQ